MQHSSKWRLPFLDNCATPPSDHGKKDSYIQYQRLQIQSRTLQTGHWSSCCLETILDHSFIHSREFFLRVRIRSRRISTIQCGRLCPSGPQTLFGNPRNALYVERNSQRVTDNQWLAKAQKTNGIYRPGRSLDFE